MNQVEKLFKSSEIRILIDKRLSRPLERMYGKCSDLIIDGITWGGSEEGRAYWREIYYKYRNFERFKETLKHARSKTERICR